MSQSLANTSQNVTFGYTINPGGQMGQRSIDNSAYVYSAPSFSAGYTPNGLNQYASVNSTSFNYSQDGNLTFDGSRTLTYDFGNRLTSVSVSGSTVMALTYDAAGRLDRTASSSNENYSYDGNTLLAEYDDAGNMLRRYVPGAGVDDTEVWYEGSGFSSPHWLYADERGSVIGASDASGSATTYNYSVTGEPGGGWGSSPPAPIFRYTGQVALSAVGLYYYKNRMYDPALGRFLQTDPIGYNGGMNLYAYAGNDPANATDPMGLDDLETVVVTGTRPPPLAGPSLSPFEFLLFLQGLGDLFASATLPDTNNGPPPRPVVPTKGTNTMCAIGNYLEDLSAKTGKASGAVVVGGAVVTGGGVALSLSGAPELGVPIGGAGLAMMDTGATGGLYAGGLQFVGGIFQGLGGAGYSNTINSGATLGASALLAGAAGAASKGLNTASGRALANFMGRQNTIFGAGYDAFVNQLEKLGPQQVSCPVH